MNRHIFHLFASLKFSHALLISVLLLVGVKASAQCTAVTAGLQMPLGITQSNQNNLIVSESGTLGVLHSGRISIVDPSGGRRTLLAGLPSATNDVGDPSGPAGVFMRGRTLYVAIGIGNTFLVGGVPNPNPASPIFSSVLAIHFSASVEKNTLQGFTLPQSAQQTLASGHKVTLANVEGDKITVELIANFPDFTIDPTTPSGFRNVNPFDLVVVGDQIYVTDGGQNLVWQVDSSTGVFSTLVHFPQIANPIPGFPALIDPVPTGIAENDGQLLVTLFSGVPFPPGQSRVELVDPITGSHSAFISGRKTAIDVLPIREGSETHYLVLQHASPTGPFFPPPGLVLRFDTPAGPPTTIASCLFRPTSMVLDEKTNTLYVTELTAVPTNGRIQAISIP